MVSFLSKYKHQSGGNSDEKVPQRAMTHVFDVRDIFQLVI